MSKVEKNQLILDEGMSLCNKCLKIKKDSDFYWASTDILTNNQRIPLCKTCINKYVKENDTNTVRDMVRSLDRPFIKKFWKQAELSNRKTFGEYMRLIGMPQNIKLTYDDSDKLEKEEYEEIDNDYINNYEITDEIKRRWIGYVDVEEIVFLEEYYQELINSYESKTPIQKRIYKNMAESQLMANKAREEGKITDYNKLLDSISKMMTDANIKPVQDKGEDDGSIATWGEWIQKIENEEPIPQAQDEFKDIDNIRSYIKKWFTGHMARILGMSSGVEDNKKEDDKNV